MSITILGWPCSALWRHPQQTHARSTITHQRLLAIRREVLHARLKPKMSLCELIKLHVHYSVGRWCSGLGFDLFWPSAIWLWTCRGPCGPSVPNTMAPGCLNCINGVEARVCMCMCACVCVYVCVHRSGGGLWFAMTWRANLEPNTSGALYYTVCCVASHCIAFIVSML